MISTYYATYKGNIVVLKAYYKYIHITAYALQTRLFVWHDYIITINFEFNGFKSVFDLLRC